MTQPDYDAIDEAQRLLNGDMRSFIRAVVPDMNDWGGITDDHGVPLDPEGPTVQRAQIEQETPDVFKTGGGFILDAPETPTAIWGVNDQVIWAEGEAFMLAAPQGVGKTTVALQVVRALLGLQTSVLGYPVRQSDARVLYLAMDRPAQMRRAAHRIFTEEDRAVLDDRLAIWQGPPPYDMAVRKDILAVMAKKARAEYVIIDSLKDAAIGISKDEVGAHYNRARQQALAEGVQIMELHHTRKANADNKQPNTIDDIFGSTWLTSGAGSVVSLWGEAGDPIVKWRHLKQPSSEVGPFTVNHDHVAGTSDVEQGPDLIAMVRRTGVNGLTAQEFAAALFETVKPKPPQVEKARRILDRRVVDGVLSSIPGDRGTRTPTRYFLAAAD